MVRGDVAQLSTGLTADNSHWYIERWIEGDVDGKKIDALVSNARETRSPVAAAPLAFAVRRVSSLAEWPLEFQLDLPTRAPVTLAIYDVAGRVSARQELTGLEPGRAKVTIASPRLVPGIYWLRGRQGSAEFTLKMVLMR
jgi:hypothetical protein